MVLDTFPVFLLKSVPERCKPCTSAVSESEFDHANRILLLRRDMPVYTVSRLSKCQDQLSIAFLFYGHFTDHFAVAKQTVKLFCP